MFGSSKDKHYERASQPDVLPGEEHKVDRSFYEATKNNRDRFVDPDSVCDPYRHLYGSDD